MFAIILEAMLAAGRITFVPGTNKTKQNTLSWIFIQ